MLVSPLHAGPEIWIGHWTSPDLDIAGAHLVVQGLLVGGGFFWGYTVLFSKEVGEAIFRVTYDFEWRLREVVSQGSGDLGKWWLREVETLGSRGCECCMGLVLGGCRSVFSCGVAGAGDEPGAVRTVMAVSICFACSCTWQLHGVLESLVAKRSKTHCNGCINAPL